MGNNTTKATYPKGMLISKKAYTDFAGRLNDTLSVTFANPTAAAEAKSLLDRYVTREETATVKSELEKCEIIVQVAFSIIIPELDKAISRSKAARQRAAARKEKKQAEADTNNDTVNSDSVNNAHTLSERAIAIEKQMQCEERVIDRFKVNHIPVRVIESPELAPEAYKYCYDSGYISKSDYSSLLERAGVAAPAAEASADASAADA